MQDSDNVNWFELVRANLPRRDNRHLARLDDLTIRVDSTLADKVQESMTALVLSSSGAASTFDDFYPAVIISYATGYRRGKEWDDYPGKLVAAGVVRDLFEHRNIACYADLMTPGGRNWEDYKLRIHSSNCQVMVALMTKAFFNSVWCLEEVMEALDHQCMVLPVRVETVTSNEGIDISRDSSSMWPDHVLYDWVYRQEGCFDKGNREVAQSRMNELKRARIAVVKHITSVSSIPVQGTLLENPDRVMEHVTKRIHEIIGDSPTQSSVDANTMVKCQRLDDDDDNHNAVVIDAYFAMQCQPSKLLRNLDGRPEMLRDLDIIHKYIQSKSGRGQLFDRDYNIYLTDGTTAETTMGSSLLDLSSSFRIRVLIWCAQGVDECSMFPNCEAIAAALCSGTSIVGKHLPEVVIVCMEYGAKRTAKRLRKEMNVARVIWMCMNPFQDLEMVTKNVFLPFCVSYSNGKGFQTCANSLLFNLQHQQNAIGCIACDFMPKQDDASSELDVPRLLECNENIMPVHQIDLRSTISLHWDCHLKNLKLDQTDLEKLEELKETLSPSGEDFHYFVYIDSHGKHGWKRSRALAFIACLDMTGDRIFDDGIHRITCEAHKCNLELAEPIRALVWIDLIRWMKSPFKDGDELVAWLSGLGQNLTAAVLLTADSKQCFEQLETIVKQLQKLQLKVNAVHLTESATRNAIPVNSLIGSFSVRSRLFDSDGNIVPLLDLCNINPLKFVNALKDAIFSLCQGEGEEMFDGYLYCDDAGSVRVRFFVRNVRCLTMLRDMILFGKATEQLATALKVPPHEIEIDRTSMADVFDGMIMQLETLTPHQQEILEESEVAIIRDKKNLHIQGMAGTGKTFLALNLVLNYLENTNCNVLYVSFSKATAFQFCKWVWHRLGRQKDVNDVLKKIFLLPTVDQGLDDKPFMESLMLFQVKVDVLLGVLNERNRNEMKWKEIDDKFDLIVVDEAHNVFKCNSVTARCELQLRLEHSTCQLILLSDASQAAHGNIHYPMHQGVDIPTVKLTQVCRCTKCIILAARCFQLDSSSIINFMHDSSGMASMAILFPCQETGRRLKTYANKIWEAIVDTIERFSGLDLHHRLAIAVPDEHCLRELRPELERKLESREATDKLHQHLVPKTAVEMFNSARRNAMGSESKKESHIVFDSVDNMAGLEFLIVLGVDLDSSLTDSAVSPRLVCSRIFRTITRAQLIFYFINEQVKNGWCNFLAYVEEKGRDSTDKFSFDDELSMFQADAAFLLLMKHEKQNEEVGASRASIMRGTTAFVDESLSSMAIEGKHISDGEDQGLKTLFPDESPKVDIIHAEVETFHSVAWNTSKISKDIERNTPLYNPLAQLALSILFVLKGHTGIVQCCAVFANDTGVVSGSYDNTLKVWDLAHGQERFTLQGHTDHVECCAVFANGTGVISGGRDCMLKVWDLTTGKELYNLRGHKQWVICCVVFANDTRVISGSVDNTLKVWDLKQHGKELLTLRGHANWVYCCAVFSQDTRVISGSSDRSLKVWNLGNGNELYSLEGHRNWVSCCTVFANDTRVISGSMDETLKVWDLANRTELYTLEGHTNWVYCCTVFADGTCAISGSRDMTLKVWDLTSGREVGTLEGHTRGVRCCNIFANDTRLISGSSDHMLMVWLLPRKLCTHK